MLSEESKALSLYRLERTKELLDEARALFDMGGFKGSNNRAYYAIFSAMRAVLALDDVDFKKHSGVIQYFQREYIKTGKIATEYSDIIMKASRIRNASDYDDFYIASKDEALAQIENAEKLYQEVGKYIRNIIG